MGFLIGFVLCCLKASHHQKMPQLRWSVYARNSRAALPQELVQDWSPIWSIIINQFDQNIFICALSTIANCWSLKTSNHGSVHDSGDSDYSFFSINIFSIDIFYRNLLVKSWIFFPNFSVIANFQQRSTGECFVCWDWEKKNEEIFAKYECKCFTWETDLGTIHGKSAQLFLA